MWVDITLWNTWCALICVLNVLHMSEAENPELHPKKEIVWCIVSLPIAQVSHSSILKSHNYSRLHTFLFLSVSPIYTLWGIGSLALSVQAIKITEILFPFLISFFFLEGLFLMAFMWEPCLYTAGRTSIHFLLIILCVCKHTIFDMVISVIALSVKLNE